MGEPYDVVIVGSGAAGGMAAYELTRRGLKVLMLEAGRDYDPQTETPMMQMPGDAPLRAEATPDKPFGFHDATVGGGWTVPGEPYTIAPGSQPFIWWRPRMLGGRTNHWARVSLRFGPLDFKPYSRDGLGVDWPITYEELAPWYDKVERLIGVSGGPAQGLLNVPDSPPGCLQPAPEPKAYEMLVSSAFKSMGIPTAPIRAAILTRALGDRPACIYATPCVRGCSIKANFQTPTVLLPPALATGKLTILTDAVVYEVEVGSNGLAKGVRWIDRKTGEHRGAGARAVVLAAGSCSSARILLNSTSPAHHAGIGNEHGMVGRYLMDSVGMKMQAQVPALEGMPSTNDDGMSIMHTYVPWWGHERQKELGFARGYHVEMNGGRVIPSLRLAAMLDGPEPIRGRALREAMRRRFGSVVTLSQRGEMIPNEHSYCELDPEVKDKWGIPVLRFHWRWGEHEIKQVEHAVSTFEEVFTRLKATPVDPIERDGAKAISKGGEIIHEVGTLRMGADPKTSVVNSLGQCWSMKNLFVCDGGVMPSSPDKNPTLSILALAWRSTSHMADLAARGELA